MARLILNLIAPPIAAVFALAASANQAASQSCQAREAQLQEKIQSLASQASSLGICSTARRSAQLYREAAGFNRACGGSAGQAQAVEYERAAREADSTAAASCK